MTVLKAGVIGWPISHSVSPHLHGFWLSEYQIDGVYEPFAVEPENLRKFMQNLAAEGRRGTNVTLPHKQATLSLMDEVEDQAARIGAVNTVVVQESGKLIGSNTDGFGFMENLKTDASGIPTNWQASQGPAVVLGAGGAARAILVALQDARAPEIRLLNRTKERADQLAEEFGAPIKVYEWERRAEILSEATTVVNTTSLGMVGQPPLEIDLGNLPVSAMVTDIVYSPLETDLLAAARRRGNQIVDGLGMLLHQARPGFAAWFGVEPEVNEALRNHVLKAMAG